MLQAMNTGHEGSMTTMHANTPRDALSRLETMVLMANANLPNRAMRDQISSALHLVIQVARLSDGTRRVTSVVELTGMEGDVITTQEIYRFAAPRHRAGRHGRWGSSNRPGSAPSSSNGWRRRARRCRPKCSAPVHGRTR